jgi:hypothetical protein
VSSGPFFLAPSDVTAARLAELLAGAGLPAQVDADGDVRIEDPSGLRLFLTADTTRHILTCFTVLGVREDADEATRLRYVNALNTGRLLVRFSQDAPDSLFCDVQVPYAQGISVAQLLEYLRLMSVVVRSIAAEDSAGLLDL